MSQIAAALQDDFPDLDLVETVAAVAVSRHDTQARLRRLDQRVDGRRALAMRTEPVPRAYRAFARQIGLDGEADAGTLAALLRARIVRGTLPSTCPVADVCTIAMIETGVPVWGLDGQRVVGPLRIETADDLSLVVREAERVVAPLLGAPVDPLATTTDTRVARLYAIVVAGVPRATVLEALWVAEQALRT